MQMQLAHKRELIAAALKEVDFNHMANLALKETNESTLKGYAHIAYYKNAAKSLLTGEHHIVGMLFRNNLI